MHLRPLQIASRRQLNRNQAATQNPLQRPTVPHATPEVFSEPFRKNPQPAFADHNIPGRQKVCCSVDNMQSNLHDTSNDLCIDRASVGCLEGAVRPDTSSSLVQALRKKRPHNGRRMTLEQLQRQINGEIITESLKRDARASKPPSAATSITSEPDFDSVVFNASQPQDGEPSAMKVSQTSKCDLESANTTKTITKPKGRKGIWSFFNLSRFAPTVKVHPGALTGH